MDIWKSANIQQVDDLTNRFIIQSSFFLLCCLIFYFLLKHLIKRFKKIFQLKQPQFFIITVNSRIIFAWVRVGRIIKENISLGSD